MAAAQAAGAVGGPAPGPAGHVAEHEQAVRAGQTGR